MENPSSMTVDHFRMGNHRGFPSLFVTGDSPPKPPPMAWLEAVAATNGKAPWVPSSNRAEPEPSPVQSPGRQVRGDGKPLEIFETETRIFGAIKSRQLFRKAKLCLGTRQRFRLRKSGLTAGTPRQFQPGSRS